MAEVSVMEVGARLCPWSRPPWPRPRADGVSTTRLSSASSAVDADDNALSSLDATDPPSGRRHHVGTIARPLLPHMLPAHGSFGHTGGVRFSRPPKCTILYSI